MFTLFPNREFISWANHLMEPFWPYKPDNHNRSRYGRYEQRKRATIKRHAKNRAKR